MFSAIRYHTPAGMARHAPHTHENIDKFNDALRKSQRREAQYLRQRKKLMSGEDQ